MDKKLIIFLILFSGFYFLYYKFVLQPIEKEEQLLRSQKKVAAPAETPKAPEAVSPAPVTAPPITPPGATSGSVVKQIAMETPLYRAEFSTQGAVLTSFRLKKYKDDHGKALEMVPQSSDSPEKPLQFELADKNISKIANTAVYSVTGDSLTLSNQDSHRVEFQYSDGVHSFTKAFQFKADTYLIESTLSATKDGQNLPVRVSWKPGIESVSSYTKKEFLNPSRGLVNTGDEVEHLDASEEFVKIGSTVKWAGAENNYFLAIFIPAGDRNHSADAYMIRVTEDKKPQNVNVILAGQRPEPLHLRLFVGPKDYEILEPLGMDLKEAIDFGFFGPITKGLFFALKQFYNFTKNYGWAIVLITILIKIIFTPFTQMSFASMKKMQQMQPEMKKIQEKYGKMKSDDPRKQNMNAEIMGLHKRYGVSPLGGCLPMLLQMPVLFAFYQLLSNAIELRGAPFGLWLQDLSRPDPYWVSPILMGATMLLQQKMTPATDPIQKNMMYIMPVMFTYISLNLPSGLVLYWLLSNVLAIAHQWYFQQQQQKAVPAVAKA